MIGPRQLLGLVSLAAVAIAGVLPSAVQGQYTDYFRAVPAAQAPAALNTAAAYNNLRASRANVAFSNAALGNQLLANNLYTPYNNPYAGAANPYGGYLSGAADVINSQGQFKIQSQQAKLAGQQVESARIDNRRRRIQEYLYEREVVPTLQDDEERSAAQNLRRSLYNPPATEIYSGLALNNILRDLQKKQAGGLRGPEVPLDPEAVAQVNVKTGATNGSVGPFKNGGKLTWPLLLNGSAFADDRNRMNQLAVEAFRQASYGQVDADTLNGMIDAVNNLTAQLKDRIREVPMNQYIAAKRYLDEVNDAINLLQNPSGAQLLTGKLTARGKTAAALVDNLTSQGLKFAPAIAGEEAAYTSVYNGLVAYAMGLARMAAQ